MNNLTEYLMFKERGATRLTRLTPKVLALTVRRYDVATGAETDPLIVQINADAVRTMIAQKEAEIASLRALADDIAALGD